MYICNIYILHIPWCEFETNILHGSSYAQVSNVSFPDFDLDETDLGGILTWSPPQDESQVERYVSWQIFWEIDRISMGNS